MGKDSIMTFYVGTGTISDVRDTYNNLSSYVYNFITLLNNNNLSIVSNL